MAKIVVIDDEKDICELIESISKREGFTAFSSTDPTQGLVIVQKERPDCVFVDLKMPKMGGIEVLKKIKMIDASIGVIMITGHGDIENAIEAQQIGAYDYVSKPFDIKFLASLLKRYLKSVNKI